MRRSRVPHIIGTAIVTLLTATACSSQSEIEQQRDANVAAAERETTETPLHRLRRGGDLSRRDRDAWRAVLGWPAACDERFTASGSTGGGLELHQAGAGVTIVQVQCQGGASQPTHVFVRLDERGSSPIATVLTFPVYRAGNGPAVDQARDADVAGETAWAADGHSFAVLAVSRPQRDCGIWTRYAVASEHPRVLAAAMRLPCPVTPGDSAGAPSEQAPPGWEPIPAAPR